MKKNKYAIIYGIVLFLLFIIIVINKSKVIEKMNNQKREVKNSVLAISYIYRNYENIDVDAGIYKYGDITEDGKIDIEDLDALDNILHSKLFYNNMQRLLSDVNHDNLIDKKDYAELIKMVKNSKTYDLQKDKLLYCVISDIDYNNCDWQKSSNFILNEEKTYYFYVKNIENDNVSNYYEYNHEIIDIDNMNY